jgi:hypothetical protein
MTLAAALSLAACERPAPFDPQAGAREILAACGTDSACVHERWQRDPRNWNLGLRAEVAGHGPRAPFVVQTTRALASPELRASRCLDAVADGAGIYYRTWVLHPDHGQFPFAVFHWPSFDAAAAGHRRVVAVVADARADTERLWHAIEQDSTLEPACARFRDRRDRCQESDPATSRAVP